MSDTKIQARHVFEGSQGTNTAPYWEQVTGEPCFVWGAAERKIIPLRSVQLAFREWIAENGGQRALTFYHNGAGADFLGPWDQGMGKVLLMDYWPVRWERYLDWQLRYTGRLVVPEPYLKEAVNEKFPWIPERFIQCYPSLPVASGGKSVIEERTAIWLNGNAWKASESRLRAFIDLCGKNGMQTLVLAENVNRPKWAQSPMVEWFNGSQQAALDRANCCDTIFLLNDFALNALWLRQLLAAGVFPLVPAGDAPGRRGPWSETAAPRPYAWGDAVDAVRRLKEWRQATEADKTAYAQWVSRAIGPCLAEDFKNRWEAFKAGLLNQRVPRLREFKARLSWTPLFWYQRVDRLRRGH
jgi:hypothetical protein